jgi:hypothetical protein
MSRDIDTIKADILTAKAALEKAQSALDQFEPDEAEAESRYDDMLDEVGQYDLRGMFANYQPSRVLREIDPVAYRCGMNDWLDGEDKSTFEGWEDLHDDVEDCATELALLEDELEASEEA